MKLEMVKEELMKAVELFDDGENKQAREMLENLDIAEVTECFDTCSFDGVDMSPITEYYN